MTKFDLKRATVEELIERFLSLGIEQDKMEMEGFGSRANRAIRARLDVEDELKGRDSDARRLLVRFYEHQNIQVQCNAASATLALFPEKGPSEARTDQKPEARSDEPGGRDDLGQHRQGPRCAEVRGPMRRRPLLRSNEAPNPNARTCSTFATSMEAWRLECTM